MHEELHKVSMVFEEQEYNRNMRQNRKYKPIIKSKPSTLWLNTFIGMIWHLKTFQTLWYVWQIAFKTLLLQKRGISSKLHQNAIVALNSVAVWLISECKTVNFRRNHITILQCQYITEWVELHYSSFVNINLHIRLLVLSLLVCLHIHGIHFVSTCVFGNQSNDLGVVVSALRWIS